ncbi:exodeoxyribonuclease VII large subunit [Saxibacter everestensis]|uniref:Exodeoxyribonuclease 7 large subunit n=1 Tax=Saxibacter everestensis TaxID=2909229 RepID=A0ABY8QNW9_9MICO|nr:exodeoxyribonuclease VII large subunit [Brevibacteriaceae bacterium ZFBP1038]
MAAKITGAPSTLGSAPDATQVELASTAAETTAENPWPLRLLAVKMKDYIAKMSPVWIEGQVVQFSQRDRSSFLTLRDTDVEMSLPVHVWGTVLDRLSAPLEQGARVVVNVKADFWPKNGRLSMKANDIRAVGIGELLARIEQLRQQLGNEGLFAAELKKPLPFLPQRVGLITGRNSDAMKDVLKNSRRRWPAVEFEVREVAVQGPEAVPQVTKALAELDAMPAIDVIVIARGGGSMEDLLPFSNETMVRAAAAAVTPLISAIGHEADRPLLDEVADFRASTPTDAAKHLVPDVAEEMAGLAKARASLTRAMINRIQQEQHRLDAVRSRPVLAEPQVMVAARAAEVMALRDRALRAMHSGLRSAGDRIEHLRAQVRALSPQQTLDRGYAVVQTTDGILRNADDASAGDSLKIRLAAGGLRATVDEILSAGTSRTAPNELEASADQTDQATERADEAPDPAHPGEDQ